MLVTVPRHVVWVCLAILCMFCLLLGLFVVVVYWLVAVTRCVVGWRRFPAVWLVAVSCRILVTVPRRVMKIGQVPVCFVCCWVCLLLWFVDWWRLPAALLVGGGFLPY